MSGKLRLPPDKRTYEDDIVLETPPSPSPPPKRVKRQDAKDRIARNKTLDFFVMKKTLRAFSKPEAKGLAWDECILEVNYAVAEAYLLANYYALTQLSAGRPLCVIDNDFYQLCLSLVTSAPRRAKYETFLSTQAAKDRRQRWIDGGKIGMLKDFPVTVPAFSESGYQEWLTTQKMKNADLENANDSFQRMRGEHAQTNRVHLNSGWFQAAARQMATNAKNTVVRNFAKRLRTYVIDHYELSRKDAHEVLNKVFAVEEFDPTYVRVIDPIIAELRGKTPRVSSGKISWAPHDLLPMFHKFLSDFEKYNTDNKEKPKFVEKRVFCILPTKQGFEANYCKVDSTGLRSLLKRSLDVSRDLWNPESGSRMTELGGRWKRALREMRLGSRWPANGGVDSSALTRWRRLESAASTARLQRTATVSEST